MVLSILGRKYRKHASKQYSRKVARKTVKTRRARFERVKTRKWGEITYPKGTKPVVVEVSFNGGQPLIISGLGIKSEKDVEIIKRALIRKAEKEIPEDRKVEFTIHFPKTRRKPIRFVTVGGQPVQPRIIYHPKGFTIPEELKKDIKEEWRKHPRRKTATDLEAMAYLMSASGAAPLSPEYSRIYLHLARKYFIRKHGAKAIKGGLSFLNQYRSLSDFEKRELQKLKDWIWKQQQKDLKERMKVAKQLKKETS